MNKINLLQRAWKLIHRENGNHNDEKLKKLIIGKYLHFLEREPNTDEIIHWDYYMNSGCSINSFENSLKGSLEFDQKKANINRRLVDLGTFKMYVDDKDLDVGYPILQMKTYEPHVSKILVQYLKSGHTFIDIGANIGYFSLLAASIVGESGKVISIEPNVGNLRFLYASIIENAFKNIRIFPLAASNSWQILRMQSFGSNGFLDADISRPLNFQFVQSAVLDDLLNNNLKVNIIKIDIEGYEPFALKGMQQTIAQCRPIIFTELNVWHLRHRANVEPSDFLHELIGLGYRIKVIKTTGETFCLGEPSSVMDFIQHDKDYLDLVAEPLEAT